MTTPYVDPQGVHNPAAGSKPPATWGDTIRDDLEFLIAPPSVKAVRAATQSIPDSTWTAIQFTADDEWDTDGFHSTSSNTTQLVVPTGMGGRYAIAGFARFASNATGNRLLSVYRNGAEKQTMTVAATVERNVAVLLELALAAADYVEMFVWQNSGAALYIDAGWGSLRWVSR